LADEYWHQEAKAGRYGGKGHAKWRQNRFRL
jgi:hypothetical protein